MPKPQPSLPGLVIGGTGSNSGKTTLTLALLCALHERGLAARAAKTGPDYIDAAFHAALTGQPAANLDTWMCREAAPSPTERPLRAGCGPSCGLPAGLKRVFARMSAPCSLPLAGDTTAATPDTLPHILPDILVVEGAMGLFDGGHRGTGSTAHLAALLGLPAAREASSVLAFAERELAELANAIRTANRDDEPALLDRLTRLAGQVESQYAATHSRFSASSAYFELVDRRIKDIAESRLAGMQTIGEFMDRRLTPARSTCEWAARRQDALSQRVSRMSNLLRTRVEIEQQQSSQALLATMNQRQDLQLKLQSTVEGLSVAAITYYIVGLVTYLAKGGKALGWPLSPESTAAIAIPLVAVSVWLSLRRLHHRLFRKH